MTRWMTPAGEWLRQGRGTSLMLVGAWATAVLLGPTTAAAQLQCIDNDGDGFGNPGNLICRNGGQRDCNDDDPLINPGAPELCDGIDNDCNNLIDETFFAIARDGARICSGGQNDGGICDGPEECPGGECKPLSPDTFGQFQELVVGSACVAGFGPCTAFGRVVCVELRIAECDARPTDPPGTEGPYPDPTCSDFIDNDCDGQVDNGTDGDNFDTCVGPELCDGIDNNRDGLVDEIFNLDESCTIGIGTCQSFGKMICSSNRTGVICSAAGIEPKQEGPAGSKTCFDKVDNDCDRLTDFADPDCRQEELCDGTDNDGDELIDEDFPDLRQPCTAGTSNCVGVGINVCSADGTGTVCAAIPLRRAPEGTDKKTCSDGIDNDCDGFTDAEDANCGTADLSVSCRLIPGICRDCVGWYFLDWTITGGDPNTVVTPELLAMNSEGETLARTTVAKGDTAKLAALDVPDDCVRVESIGNRHLVYAEVPMLRIIVDNGKNHAEAYCSNTNYLDVLQPSGQVVSESSGDITPLFGIITLVNPQTLFLKVDGVDLFAALGINPAFELPGGPFNGVVNINGKPVVVSNLVIDTRPLGVLSSNTVRGTLSGLGCGEHIVVLEGDPLPGALREPRREACYMDDLVDKGRSLGFEIDITTPTPNQVVGVYPSSVNVQGTVCHGQEIDGVAINRFPAPLLNTVFTPGDGEDTGSLFEADINVNVPVTNLRNVVDNGATFGSFDHGNNRLVAQALDVDANTTYDNFFFGVGPLLPPASTAAVAGGGPGEVERAFTFAITAEGLDKFFEEHKERNKGDIGSRVRQRILEFKKNFTPSIDGSCDPPSVASVPQADYENNTFGVLVNLLENVAEVRINLPGINKLIRIKGYCQTGCICAFGGCLCAVCTDIDIDFRFKRTGMGVEFDVTEQRLEERTPLDINFDPGDTDNGVHVSGEVDIGCVLGFFLDLLDVLIFISTFGLVQTNLDVISFDISGDDIKEKFGGLDGDPMDLDLVKMRNPDLSNFGARERESRISDAEINPQGIAVALGASFEPEPSEIDPMAATLPGTPAKNAPLPQPPIRDAAGNLAGDVVIAISSDVFNQLFYAATQTGRLRTQFTITRTIGDFLPDCDEIADPERRARCIGFRGGDSCDAFCRPLDGCDDVCEQEYPGLGNGELRRKCCRTRRLKRNDNIGIGTTIILHGQMQVPPQLLIDDDPATPDPVEVILRSPQVSITLIADRDGDGNFDASTLDEVPPCVFGDLEDEDPTPSIDSTMCKIWETCLQADVRFQVLLEDGPLGRPRIRFANGELIRHDEAFGALCGGGIDVPEIDFFNTENSKTEILDILEQRQRDNTPPLDGEGLELGGIMRFQRDRVIAIETQPPAQDDGFQDYIGITGTIVPPD